MSWFSPGLVFRQTMYTMIVVVALTTAVSSVEIVFAYQAENNRQAQFVEQLGGAFADIAARAAFHVDDAQANAVLDGLMEFEMLARVRLTTDLGDVLAERARPIDSGYFDFISQWLFADSTHSQRVLATATTQVPVGTLALSVSPELVGRGFAATVATLVAVLVIEFAVFASALAMIFHRTLTRPLMAYAHEIETVVHDDMELPQLDVPEAHANDELGLVMARTNQLFARINEQRAALIHREKIAALGTMLTGAAHELNNPLAVVSAQAQILRETTDDQAIKARAEKILQPAQRCAKIVMSFLELAHDRKPEKAPLRISDVIDDAVDLVAYQLETHNVDLAVSCADDLPVIAGDSVHLSQAVMNLLVNAHQAMSDQPPPRKIMVSVFREQYSVIIQVQDNGPGIPSALTDRVIEPFFTTKSQVGGTGLGLAFCDRVAKAHGGYLQILETDPHGTTVRLAIKAEQAQLPVHQSAPDSTATPQALRVLVVDDEPTLTDSFAEALLLAGHRVETAYDGATALGRIEAEPFDAVVADIRMPGMSGIELFEKSIEQHGELADRFLFVTGEPPSEALEHFLRRRGIPCLRKPINLDELLASVQRTVGRHGELA